MSDEAFVRDTTDRLARIETKLDAIKEQRQNDRKLLLSLSGASIVGLSTLATVVVGHFI